jgi:RimJ/RimL family protein N-acetyltransferase
MKKSHCGKGFGTEALRILMKYLTEKSDIDKFIIRPSLKNIRAIAAYKKAGFSIANNKAQKIKEYLLPEFIVEYGEGDYGFKKTAVLIKEN